MIDANELRARLAYHQGSETFTRHSLCPRILLTEGIVDLITAADCFWLTDVIVSHKANPKVAKELFQHWVIRVDLSTHEGVIACTNGNARPDE